MTKTLHDFFNGMTPPELKQPSHPLWPQIRDVLCTIQDPEMDVNIYELGLIQSVNLTDNAGKTDIAITMTLTTAWCPVAGDMPGWVHHALSELNAPIGNIDVKVSFAKPWAHAHMSESAKITLNLV